VQCEEQQQQLSLLVDGELDGAAQVALFSHLGACPECQGFFNSLLRFRKAARRDHQALLAEAEAGLPRQLPSEAGAAGGAPPRTPWNRWGFPARVPALAAAALAVLLLAAGVAIGLRLPAGRGTVRPPNPGSSPPAGGSHFVLVYAMPDVVVTAPSPSKPTH
jgi:anti-sigma factor RsiW